MAFTPISLMWCSIIYVGRMVKYKALISIAICSGQYAATLSNKLHLSAKLLNK